MNTLMQLEAKCFTKNDMAKYPFLKSASEYMKMPNLTINDLGSRELENVVERARERLEEAILFTRVSRRVKNADVEISSYPVAVILAKATGVSFIKRRYALAEAKQTYEDLRDESKEKILKFAEDFEWKAAVNDDPTIPYEFAVSFVDYLRTVKLLQGKKWKLVNRVVSGGNVYVTRNELARLLSEEVRKHVEEVLEAQEMPKPPQVILEVAEKIKNLSVERIGRTEVEDLPQTVVEVAFPPCIDSLYAAVSAGRHLSHVARFTLTSFLVNVGVTPENVVGLFQKFSDYNERMTKYQVEHVAGERGSRTRYIPPKCDTLKTHGVCVNPDDLCRRIRHPLSYYRIKSR